jgi:hypothetical protein
MKMNIRHMLVVLGLLTATSQTAMAEGFAIKDLTKAPDVASDMGADYISSVEADRITLACLGCPGNPMIDILIGQTTDGTEGRIRSGETTFKKMEELCQSREPACVLEGIDVAPAIGYRSYYPLGENNGSTTVIMRDGDLLTIRSLSDDAALAKSNAEKLQSLIVPSIVGN